MKHPTATRLVRTVVAMAVSSCLLVACNDGGGVSAVPATRTSTTPTAPTASSAATASVVPAPLPPGAIDPVSLPVGPPPAMDHVVDGVVHVDGRTIETDLPAGARVRIMGSVDGRVGLTGQLKRDVGLRYWAVDTDGHAEQLGEGAYESYNYPAGLVEETGHIWVHYSDRGTGRSSTWAIDVRTGEELFELRDGEDPPPGLAPADQAVVAIYEGDGDVALPPPATSPDGAWVARTRGLGRSGEPRYAVVVRRARSGEELRRVVFAKGAELADLSERLETCLAPEPRCAVFVSVGTPVWEDDEHVLVTVGLVTQDTGYRRADVEEATIVRCDLDGRCERATDVVASASLGADPGL